MAIIAGGIGDVARLGAVHASDPDFVLGAIDVGLPAEEVEKWRGHWPTIALPAGEDLECRCPAATSHPDNLNIPLARGLGLVGFTLEDGTVRECDAVGSDSSDRPAARREVDKRWLSPVQSAW